MKSALGSASVGVGRERGVREPESYSRASSLLSGLHLLLEATGARGMTQVLSCARGGPVSVGGCWDSYQPVARGGGHNQG